MTSRKRATRGPAPSEQIILEIRDKLRELKGLAVGLSRPAAKKSLAGLEEIRGEIANFFNLLDPIREPVSLFDPADPDTAGRLVALALVAQDRVPLGKVARMYGAGVYAIYYKGDHPAYALISGTETPIYVGKADPKSSQAKSAREQGDRLYGRLNDHRKSIRKVQHYAEERGLEDQLRVSDFECRRLVVVTNAQLAAERHLIGMFRPVWNWEVSICWGISKHGDTNARSNSRSPWDVLHPGRLWAMNEKLADSKPRSQILSTIAQHFADHPPFTSREQILERFLTHFAQDPLIAAEEVVDETDEGNDEREAE